MADTKNKNTAKKEPKKTVKMMEAPVEETGASVVEPKKQEQLPPITNDYVVQVASAVHGELIFVSKTTGYKVKWNEFGEQNPFTVRDLFDMRNGNRGFFTNNWITIEDPRADEVLKLLGVDKFYPYIRSVNDVDTLILDTEADEMSEIVSRFPQNTKELVAQRAFELKEDGVLDSAKTIKAIEEATNMTLDE